MVCGAVCDGMTTVTLARHALDVELPALRMVQVGAKHGCSLVANRNLFARAQKWRHLHVTVTVGGNQGVRVMLP